MSSTSTLNNQKSAIGAQIQAQGGNVQIRDIHVNVNKPQVEIYDDEFNMPQLIDTFQGREEEFKKLDKLFFSKNKFKVVIHGLPGYGKTELSKQFAQQCLEKNKIKHIFWIKAENEGELNKLSRNLKNNNKQFANVSCMFVFDNALNRRSICDYEPSNKKKHKMLITSHTKNWGYGVVPLKLNPLSSKPVEKIFNRILEENYKKEDCGLYVELAQTVDNVPLGIQIVAGYVRQRMNCLRQSFELSNCVEEMKQSKQKIINDTFSNDNPNPYKNSIFGALIISLHKIKEEEETEIKELALIILYASAFLNPERIFINNLLQIPTIKELTGHNKSEIQLKAAVGLLTNFSFVNYGDSDVYIKIHRLTQSFLIYYLSSCNVQHKYYSACLYSMFCLDKFGARSLLSYADINTVHECVGFLKKVFQDSNKILNKFMYEHDLFYYASKWDRIEILELLLQHADINETNYNGHIVLYSVARTWNTKAIELLIERGVDINYRDAANKTPIDALLSTITSLDSNKYDIILSTLTVLLRHGASINVDILNKELEFSLLSSAIERNQLELLELLLQQGVNVNSRGGKSNCTALHVATATSNLKTIHILLTHGANTNAQDLNKETATFKFVQCGIFNNRNIDKQKLRETLDLLNCKEHARITNIRGYSLLDLAVLEINENLVSLLIQTYGCHVNEQNNFGNTPLHQLLCSLDDESDKEEVVRTVQTLIQCGASLDIKNTLEQTPLQMLQGRSKLSGYNLKYLVPLLTPTDTETKLNGHKRCNII